MIEIEDSKRNLDFIEKRHSDIKKLLLSIEELRDMFVDLARLVQVQVRLFSLFYLLFLSYLF